MKNIVLPYSATPNPLGFPGEYPAERRRVEDKDTIPDGWIEVTEEEWKRRFETHYETVAALTRAAEAAKNTAEQAKQSQFEGFIATLKALREKLSASGKLEPSEQAELFTALIDALIAREQQNP